jgi:5-methylcytosine-specific restriction enzyme A
MRPRAPKACGTIGCTNSSDDGGSKCAEHRAMRRSGTWGTNRTATPEWRRLRKQIPNRCTFIATAVDHTIPKSAGGSDDPRNLASSCEPCHRHKTAVEARWWQHQQGPPPWPDDPTLMVKGPQPPPAPTPAARRSKRKPGQPITFATAPKSIVMKVE